MPIETCKCGTTFAVGFLRCPRCQTVAPLFAGRVKEESMPKITVAAGPSNAGAVEGEVGYIKSEPTEGDVAEIRGEPGPEAVDLPDGATVAPARTDWSSLSVAKLREHAKDRNLSTTGSKADLAARIAEHEAGQATAEAAPEAPAEQEVSA